VALHLELVPCGPSDHTHLILTVQRYMEGLLPTHLQLVLEVAISPLHRVPFLVHLPRPPLPPAAHAPALRRRRRGARRGGGDRLEGNAVGRDPGSCCIVPNGLGDSLAVSLIEAQFEPHLLLPLQLGRAELRSDPK
jgi:hypothetical protein